MNRNQRKARERARRHNEPKKIQELKEQTRGQSDALARAQGAGKDMLAFIERQQAAVTELADFLGEMGGKLQYALRQSKKSAEALAASYAGARETEAMDGVERVIAERDDALGQLGARDARIAVLEDEVADLRYLLNQEREAKLAAQYRPPEWLLRVIRKNPNGLPPAESKKVFGRVIAWAADTVNADRIATEVLKTGTDAAVLKDDPKASGLEGLSQDELDELVHDAKAAEAAAINNAGPDAQREFLAEAGA